jgi:peptide/nickel transport system substrate-binding protein
MDTSAGNYWRRFSDRRRSRRAFLRQAGLAGAAVAGAALVACKEAGPGNSGAASKSASGSPSAGGSAQGVAALIGRSGAKPSGSPVMGGTLNAAAGLNPPTLDPHGSSSAASFAAVNPVMSRLLRYKSLWDVTANFNRDIEPDLATSAESPDATTWTFKLRTDAKFQNIAPVNGHPVQAEDIKQTYIRATSPVNANRGSLGMIDPAQIQTPDANTVVFKLKYPYAPFSKTMASGVYGWVFPREVANDGYDPAKTLIGSGPFLLDSYTPDVALTYKKNPDWFEKPRPYVDGVRMAIIPDVNSLIAQLTSGNLDYVAANGISENNVGDIVKQNPKAEKYVTWGPGDGQMYFPLGSDTNSPFKDIRLRRAVSLLFDRSAMTQVAFNGNAIPDFYTPQSFGKWSLHMEQLPADTAQWYKFNVQQARQLIDAGGAANLQIKYLSPTPFPPGAEPFWFHTEREMVANFLTAGQWKSNLVLIDYTKDWVNGGKGVRYGNFPSPNDSMVWAGLEGRQDVDEYVFGWYDSQSSTNLSHLKDDKLDSMIAQARTIVNDDDRAKAYIDLQKYMADQMFSVAGNPNGLAYYFIQPRVSNFTYGDNYGAGTTCWGQLWLQGGTR